MIPLRFHLRSGTAGRSLFASILPCLLLLVSCQGGGDRAARENAAPPDTLTVACYNVQNLFDLVRDGSEYDEYTPLTHNWNEFTFQTKLHHIASVLAAADAHVAVLCEVENQNTLELLRKAAAEHGVRYDYSATGATPNHTTTCPAILSMLPIVATRGHGTVRLEGYFSRNILEADIAVGADTLTVFANHWPSKHHSESLRVATAAVLAARLRELPPNTEYVIAGDLNANYNEAHTFAAEGLDNTEGCTGVNHVLATVVSTPGEMLEYVGERALGDCPERCHYDLWLELPPHRRMSYVYEGRLTTPDHILLPASLYDGEGLSYVDGSFEVFTFGGRLVYRGRPYKWRIGYGRHGAYHVGEGYSDHLPIMARLCRGAFVATDTIAESAAGDHPPAWGSFETGAEGWLGMERGVLLSRDTTFASQGTYSLHVAGTVGSGNATVARCVLRPPRAGARARAVRLSLRGHGELYWRMRPTGSKTWRYFNPPGYPRSGSGRYRTVSYDTWKTVKLDFGGSAETARAVEIELRGGKHSEIRLWIDEVSVE